MIRIRVYRMWNKFDGSSKVINETELHLYDKRIWIVLNRA